MARFIREGVMNIVFSTAEKAAIAAEARKRVASGGSHHEATVSFFHEHGFDKLESVNSLIQAGIPVAQSKPTSPLSPIWHDAPSTGKTLPEAVKPTVTEAGKTQTSG